ncbi:MAG: hypothetical protein OXF23_05025 [Candidatus Dadabacteria bacterium]|nr:hypothetical protein [Candidatus Dadabacteria bacterium]
MDVERFKPQPGPQAEFLASEADIAIYGGGAGSGKLAVLGETIIHTPFGPKLIDEIGPGSIICDAFGGIQKVLATRDWPNWEIWKVSFSDGTHVLTSPQHLWLAWRSHKGRKSHNHPNANSFGEVHGINAARLYETQGLLAEMEKGHRMRIPMAKPAVGNFNRYEIDPYTLGALLGDGSLSKDGLVLHNHPDDIDIVDRIKKSQDSELTCYRNKGKSAWKWRFPKGSKTYHSLNQLGLIGKRAWEKYLPSSAVHAVIEWRWALLQGLMDTDGWCEPKKGSYFSTTSP